jgi:DNA-binding HxlR family transcriptional regulator
MRTYGDPCGIARALDLVGERWALLIVRELNLGPKRFTDLRAGLPTASPNVLSQRLRELEEAGVIEHRRLPPPARIPVYELTDWGHELEPVLITLGRWGSRAPARHQRQLSVDALIMALITTFDPTRAEAVTLRVGLLLGEDRFTLAIRDGQLEVVRKDSGPTDATIGTDVGTLRTLVFSGGELAPLLRDGRVALKGDANTVERFLDLFTLQPTVTLVGG